MGVTLSWRVHVYLEMGLKFNQYSERLSSHICKKQTTNKQCFWKHAWKTQEGIPISRGLEVAWERNLCWSSRETWSERGGSFQEGSNAYKANGSDKWRVLGNCMMQVVRNADFKEESDLIRLEFQRNQLGSKVDRLSESPTMYWRTQCNQSCSNQATVV